MTPRPAPLALVLAALAAFALMLAVIFDRVEPVLIAVPLIVMLVRGLAAMPPTRITLAHTISTERAVEGDPVTVTVTVTAEDEIPALEILYRLPPSVALASGSNRVVLRLAAGETVAGSFDIRCLARGHVRLGEFHVRLWHPSRLKLAEARRDHPLRLSIYPAAAPLRLLPKPLRTRATFGNHVSAQLGQGIEPGDIRPYGPGHLLKQINWRASLRLGRLYVTEFHEERNADVVILLDTTADVGAQPESSLDHCVKAAAALATAYLRHRDRVGLVTYGGNVQWIRPGTGRRQVEVLLEALLPTGMAGNYSFQDLDLLPPRVLPAGALVIALSPLVDQRFTRILTNLAERNFDVVLLALSPLPLMRRFTPASPMQRLAARIWTLERRTLIEELRQRGLAATELVPGEPLDAALAALARRRTRRAIAR
ncbi:MAG: DUF58 domain-containing protein [Alphaproteobacteria bacterium]|nr:DUF58 domain-containing protein [Alphaproteobacteria bacterium]